jgi:hypothetical protein
VPDDAVRGWHSRAKSSLPGRTAARALGGRGLNLWNPAGLYRPRRFPSLTLPIPEANPSLVDRTPAAFRRSDADPARKATGRWVHLANAADGILEAPGADPGDAEPVGQAVARLIAVGNRQLEAGLHAMEIGRRSRLIRGLSEAYSGSRKVKGVGITVDSSVALRGRGRTLPLRRHPPRQARGQLPGDAQAGLHAPVPARPQAVRQDPYPCAGSGWLVSDHVVQ